MSVSEAQKKASVKYLEKLDEVRVRAEKGTKNRWKNAAASRGKSLNQFVVDAVEHEISVGTGRIVRRNDLRRPIPSDTGAEPLSCKKEVGRKRLLRNEDGKPRRHLPTDEDHSGGCQRPRCADR